MDNFRQVLQEQIVTGPGSDGVSGGMQRIVNIGVRQAGGVIALVEQHAPVGVIAAAPHHEGVSAIQAAIVPGVAVATAPIANRPAASVVPISRGVIFWGDVLRQAKHSGDRGCVEQRARCRIIKAGGEAHKVNRRGQPAAMRIHVFEIPTAVRIGYYAPRTIEYGRGGILGMVLYFGRQPVGGQGASQGGTGEQKRAEYHPADVFGIGQARHRGDDLTQQAVPVVAVGVDSSGIVLQWLAGHVGENVGLRDRQRTAQGSRNDGVAEHGVKRQGAIPAAQVLQQVADGDVCQAGVGRLAGGGRQAYQVFHLAAQRQVAILNQPQNGRGGEWFGEAGDAEQRGRLDGQVFCIVRVSVAARQYQPAAARHRQRSAGDISGLHKALHGVVEASQFGKVVPGGRPQSGRRSQGLGKGALPTMWRQRGQAGHTRQF